MNNLKEILNIFLKEQEVVRIVVAVIVIIDVIETVVERFKSKRLKEVQLKTQICAINSEITCCWELCRTNQ